MDIGKVKIMMAIGEAGTSIASIEKTASTASTETYTITLTDGSTTSFEIEKGVGIASIEKTSTVGLVDTYTITMTDGTTTTFDVINGQSYTVPSDGVIYYEGNSAPEGYEETDPPSGQNYPVKCFSFDVEDGMTVSSSVEIGSVFLQANVGTVAILGMVSGTISADGTTVTITVKLDGVTAFTFSQICNAGANTIPINAGVEIATNGNHVISVECSASDGTFTI